MSIQFDKQIYLDDGLQFGIGVFETLAINADCPVLLDYHLERINKSLEFFKIDQKVTKEEVLNWLEENQDEIKNNKSLPALKILVTEGNKLFLFRENPYNEEKIEKGFVLAYSPILRNESSPFVAHKTINYGDNILEMRRIKGSGVDEVIFLNSRGEICEGSRTNIFFVKDGQIITPAAESGLLPGTLRRYLLEEHNCQEKIIYKNDIKEMEEAFISNALMGIMPVTRLEDKSFSIGPVTRKCIEAYRSKFLDKET